MMQSNGRTHVSNVTGLMIDNASQGHLVKNGAVLTFLERVRHAGGLHVERPGSVRSDRPQGAGFGRVGGSRHHGLQLRQCASPDGSGTHTEYHHSGGLRIRLRRGVAGDQHSVAGRDVGFRSCAVTAEMFEMRSPACRPAQFKTCACH